ncbi:MAG: sn-glycerol-3-phosphate ABC transporter ATP-binding protein UgpC [Rhodobacteraceae bacterium]|nr:sn-glycerol-3-phosphate ABC transporter ATP-binding protein UgpC [Paracoccaceae bacterium]
MGQIAFQNITKSFGAVAAIRDVSVDIAEGEFVVFVGPSGCGKSTLLRMLAGLETVTSGQISIGGETVTDLPPKDRDIAMVFQNYALYPHMSVAENIGFPLRIERLSKTEQQTRVASTAALLGLENLLDRHPRELSGGQRQRVAMGRAIVRHPQTFLFDEPLSNLDAALRVQMRKEIKLLHDRLNATMIYVTHDQIEAMTMADKIAVLRDGRVEQIARPLEIYHRPANSFVASFIGSPPINLIDCMVRDGRLVTRKGGVTLTPLPPESAAEEDRLTLGIRPEDLVLRGKTDAELIGQVSYLEATGQVTVVSVELNLGTLTVLQYENAELSVGDEVGVLLSQEKVHLFGPDGTRM